MKKNYKVSIFRTRTANDETKETNYSFEFDTYERAYEFYLNEMKEEAEICSLLSSFKADAVIKMYSQDSIQYRVKISN